MYNFDGKHKHRPVVSLGGASKKEERSKLLQRNAEERTRREETRQKLAAAIKIQAFYRGWVSRKQEGKNLRKSFDAMLPSAAKDHEQAGMVVFELLKKISFFFDAKEDLQRLSIMCQMILKLHNQKKLFMGEKSNQGLYMVKRLLLLCCRTLEVATTKDASVAMPLRILEVFTDHKSYSDVTDEEARRYSGEVLVYIVKNGFFKYLKILLEAKVPASIEWTAKPPTPLAGSARDLILRPINFITTSHDSVNMQARHVVLNHFAVDMLSEEMPIQISHFLLPSIASDVPLALLILVLLKDDKIKKNDLPLNSFRLHKDLSHLNSQWLLYSLLIIAEKQISMLSPESLMKYTILIRKLLPHLDTPIVPKSRMCEEGTPDSESESEDDEGYMDVTEPGPPNRAFLREKCLEIFDSRMHIDQLLSLVDTADLERADDKLYLESLYHMAHLLISIHKGQVHKTRFLYRLAFRNIFLRKLWLLIRKVTTVNSVGKELSLLQLLTRGSSLTLPEQEGIVPVLNVFATLFRHALFCIYDTDFHSDTAGSPKSSMPFSIREIVDMCQVLRDVVIGLIELMYSETRPLIVQSYGKAIKSINARRNFGISQVSFYNSLCLNVTSLVMQLHSRDCRHQFCPEDSWLSQRIAINPEQLEISDFLEQANEEKENKIFGISALTARNLAILQLMPFTIPFMQRVVIFQRIIGEDKRLIQGDNPYISQSSFLNISVNRKYLYQDAYDQLSEDREPDIKRIIRVQMINVQGLDEAGIDGGGIFREFMDQLLKTGFDPRHGFFKATPEQLLYPNPQANRLVPNYQKHFHFLGRMLGKAIYENMMIELRLAPFFLCKLLNRQSADVDIHHLESLDPELYRNLLYLKNYEGNVEDLALNFTVINDEYGEVQVHELKQGGREIPVTDANKIEYIHLMADYKLNKQIRGHCNAFRAGLADVINIEWLQMFDHREFQILISGAPVPVDLKDLRQNTNYSGGYSDDDPYVTALWEILEDLTDTQKRRFLKFVTSCSSPPLLGFIDLYPKMCIHHGGKEDRLPSASTCMNMLKLPEYKDVATLKDRLLYAIESGAGFELS